MAKPQEKPQKKGVQDGRVATGVPSRNEGVVMHRFEASGHSVKISKLGAEYQMTSAQLAETAGLKPSTLTRKDRRDSPKTQHRMREMTEILSRVESWAGGPGQAMAWYRAEPIPALDGRTAEALVKSGQVGAVREYLDHLALGGFA